MELDTSSGTLNKKIRNAQLAQFNFVAVVGEKEEQNRSVNLRSREKKDPLVSGFEQTKDQAFFRENTPLRTC